MRPAPPSSARRRRMAALRARPRPRPRRSGRRWTSPASRRAWAGPRPSRSAIARFRPRPAAGAGTVRRSACACGTPPRSRAGSAGARRGGRRRPRATPAQRRPSRCARPLRVDIRRLTSVSSPSGRRAGARPRRWRRCRSITAPTEIAASATTAIRIGTSGEEPPPLDCRLDRGLRAGLAPRLPPWLEPLSGLPCPCRRRCLVPATRRRCRASDDDPLSSSASLQMDPCCRARGASRRSPGLSPFGAR